MKVILLIAIISVKICHPINKVITTGNIVISHISKTLNGFSIIVLWMLA